VSKMLLVSLILLKAVTGGDFGKDNQYKTVAFEGTATLNYPDLPGYDEALRRLKATTCQASLRGNMKRDPLVEFKITDAYYSSDIIDAFAVTVRDGRTVWFSDLFFAPDSGARNYVKGVAIFYRLSGRWTKNHFQALIHLHELCHRGGACKADAGCAPIGSLNNVYVLRACFSEFVDEQFMNELSAKLKDQACKQFKRLCPVTGKITPSAVSPSNTGDSAIAAQ
jgi:hypothetical protein